MVEQCPNYRVSSLGSVKGPSGRLLKASPNEYGYARVRLYGTRAPRWASVHVLVAEAFVPNPESKPIVNHINGRREDNEATNLEWVSAAENSQRKVSTSRGSRARKVVQLSLSGEYHHTWDSLKGAAIATVGESNAAVIARSCKGLQRSAGGFMWKYLDDYSEGPEDEEWRPSPDESVREVSSLGRVRTKTGVITFGTKHGHYRMVANRLVHRLVAFAFLGDPPPGMNVVNHLDGDGNNNRIQNLEWAHSAANTAHAYATGLNPKNRAVRQHLPGGDFVDYPSAAEAARQTGFNDRSIAAVCRGGAGRRRTGGFVWSYTSDPVDAAPSASPGYSLDDVYEPPTIEDEDPFWRELGL